MKPDRFLSSLIAFVVFSRLAPAQTATWIAPGPYETFAGWNNPANWDTGAVPAGPGAVAVINQSTNVANTSSVPGGAIPVLTGTSVLGELRFDLPADGTTRFASVSIGGPNPGDPPGRLQLGGAGLSLHAARNSAFTYVDLFVRPGSSLDFLNQATVATTGPGLVQLRLRLSGTAGNPSYLRFLDDSSPGNNTLRPENFISGPTVFEFRDRASAGANTFPLSPASSVLFFDQSSAGTSRFGFAYGGPANPASIRFGGSSTAAQSTITSVNSQNGVVEFTEQATGGTASLSGLHRLDISGAVAAGGATGRQRAVNSTLAPISVVATDARTIALGQVQVQDLLLGSNTLELTGGYIGNIRDSGGAYLSGAGENLVGGGLLKTGPGSLWLYGPNYDFAHYGDRPFYNVFSGLTTIRGGSITLSNRLASVNVEAAGTFISGGPVAFVEGELRNAGTVQPSFGTDPAGALRVVGDYVQTATGRLELQAVNEPGSYGRLTITGTANLAGRLDIFASPSFFPNGAPGKVALDIIHAGQVTGKFDTVSSWVRIKPTVEYRADGVGLQLELLPIAALGTTPGRKALGAYLDALHQTAYNSFPNNYLAIEDGINTLATQAKVSAVLDNFSPDRYGMLLDQGFATALARRSALDRLTRDCNRPQARGAVFAEGGRRRLTVRALDGLPEAAATTDTRLAGWRWRTGPWTLGAYVASDKSHLTLDSGGSQAEIKGIEPGVFARYDRGPWFADAGAGFSGDRYQLTRVVDYVYFSPAVTRNTAAPHGRRTDLSLTAGRIWPFRAVSLTPFLGFVSSRWRLDDFTETHDHYLLHDPLNIAGWSRDSRRTRLGVAAVGRWLDGRLQPRLTATWWHEFAEDRSIPARFVSAPAGYLAPGRPADADIFQVTASLDVRLNRHAALQLGGSGQQGEHTRTASDFTAGLHWEF